MLGMIARPRNFTTYAGGTDPAQDAAFPMANLANNDYGRVYKPTPNFSVGGMILGHFDLGANPPAIDGAALLWHNLYSTDTITVRGSNTSNVSSSVLFTTNALAAITGASGRDVAAPGKFLVTFDSPKTYRYWQFSAARPSGAAARYQASRAVLFQRQLFDIGPQRAEFSAVDLNQKVIIETGEDRSGEDSLLIRPIAELDFSYAKESDMAAMLGPYTLGLGTSLPMMIVPDLFASNLQDQIVFGRPEGVIGLQSEVYDVWRTQARVRSYGP